LAAVTRCRRKRTEKAAVSLLGCHYRQANGNTNPEGGKYHEYFSNYLKAKKDPRLEMLSVVVVKQF
jgi:hypothetical protein